MRKLVQRVKSSPKNQLRFPFQIFKPFLSFASFSMTFIFRLHRTHKKPSKTSNSLSAPSHNTRTQTTYKHKLRGPKVFSNSQLQELRASIPKIIIRAPNLRRPGLKRLNHLITSDGSLWSGSVVGQAAGLDSGWSDRQARRDREHWSGEANEMMEIDFVVHVVSKWVFGSVQPDTQSIGSGDVCFEASSPSHNSFNFLVTTPPPWPQNRFHRRTINEKRAFYDSWW